MASTSTTIRVAREPDRRTALGLVLRPLAPEARGPLLDAVGAAEPQALGPLDALLVAEQAGRLAAAAWAQPAPGHAAALWAPEWSGERPGDAEPTERSLVAAATEACDAARIGLTQALFEKATDPRCAALEANGFIRIAELEYLGRAVAQQAEPQCEESGLRFEPYSASQHNRLKRLLKQTYVGSLDCPGLDGIRDLEDVLAGYRATGRYESGHWFFAVEDGVDLGVLLMADHPDSAQAELVYMGVTPAARGKGLGERLIEQAFRAAQVMGAEHLMVAVDKQNEPARRLYLRAGLAAWARRFVYVRARGGAKPRTE